MSNRASDDVLRELAFLAALDSVQAKVDTSVIAEIQDWSGAVVGKFFGATVEQPPSAFKPPSELPTIAPRPVAVSAPPSSSPITSTRMEYVQATDSRLISGLFQDDVVAWQEFVRRFQPLIASTIFKAVRRKGDVSLSLVEDLVQEVFLQLCGKDFHILKNFDLHHDEALPSLLAAIARNTAQDYFRSATSSKRGGAPGQRNEYARDIPVLESIPANDSSSAFEKEVLMKEIDLLLRAHSEEPNFERDYKIFWLYFRDGLTAGAISHLEGVGLTTKGVESVLSRLTQQIRASLAFPPRKNKTEL